MEQQKEKTVHCYERKEEFWISAKRPCTYADIILPEGDTEFHVKGNEIKTPERVVTLEKGDVVEIAGCRVAFFEDFLEITGDVEEWDIRLPQTDGKDSKFNGFPYYKRSPRIIYRIKEETIEVKAPPQKKNLTKGSILQMILPALSTMAFTILMGVVLKRGLYVYMSVGMTFITLCFSIKNFVEQRKEMKKEQAEREKMYLSYLMRIRKKIRKARAKEREAMDYQNPSPETLEKMVLNYSSRLYERTLLDDDFLQVNLGYCTGKSKVTVSFAKDELDMQKDELIDIAREIPKEYGTIERIPVTVDLKKAHLGLVGSKANIHEQLKYLLMQLTFFQSYHDLQIVFIHPEAYKEEFSYMRWYPHLKIQSINVTGEICNEHARDQVLGSIQQILKDRKLKVEQEKQETRFRPHILFIIDEPRLILNHAIMEYLQVRDQRLGFSIIYTTDQQANLPENIQTICLLENAKDGVLLLNEGERKNRGFELINIKDIHLEEMARTISAVVHEQGVSSKIPDSITFFDMYGVEHPQELEVEKRWMEHQAHKSLAVPIGVRAKEDYVELNLHEKAHGPHGLVAGTTGSGKSELVQSYILSLAVNFHPHEVGFLLIDYKGGGMANLFANLPHLLGTITNLDKSESMRAMASIKSELARRQQLFGVNNVNHINGYSKLFRLGRVKEPLPHLFIISDEFAELKKEQPEFMSELVSTARIGRSLGIHLILATQKPSGVVDDQIWTNSKFRLCLKVQDAGDSKEMLKTPDAANITQAGRAYLQVGNNEIYELFQSAWSGAAYDGFQSEEEKEDDRVYIVNELGQGELINQDLSGPKESNQIKATQLDVIVEHLKEVYESSDSVPVKKTWLPSLPMQMVSPYTMHVADSASFEQLDLELGLGMMDIPEEQVQREYVLNLIRNGHFMYMASSGYGKSLLLTHIVMGLAMKNSVKNLNFYIIDLGNSALIQLKGMPHVADYMGIEDTEKFGKFQKLINDEIAERKRQFAHAMAQNFMVYNQSSKDKLKAIVIVLDNYDVIGEMGDEAAAFLQKVARDGASLGIYLIITLTRQNVIRSSTKAGFKEKIAGFNFESGENNSFIGRSSYELKEEAKGRALVKQDGIHLMQLYTPVAFTSELEYNEKLRRLIKQVCELSSEEAAAGIPVLPETLHYDMLSQYPDYTEEPSRLPIGIERETLRVRMLDMAAEPALIVGSSGTGRTNTVKTLLAKLEPARYKVYLFDAGNENLRSYSQWEQVRYAVGEEMCRAVLEEIKELVKERKELYEEARLDNLSLQLKAFGQSLEPVFIIVDVVQELCETLNGATDALDILADAVQCGCYVCVTSDVKISRVIKSKFLQMLMESRQGLVLGNIKNQQIFQYTGIREDNHQPDLGYYHKAGVNERLKLIANE